MQPNLKTAEFKAQLVVKGLFRPTGMVFVDENEILVTEKRGIVQRIIESRISPHPVLDIRAIVNSTGERGLLSIGISNPSDVEKNYNNDNAAAVYLLFTNYAGKNISVILTPPFRNLKHYKMRPTAYIDINYKKVS